jgi:hypothetical protein
MVEVTQVSFPPGVAVGEEVIVLLLMGVTAGEVIPVGVTIGEVMFVDVNTRDEDVVGTQT